MGCPVSPAFSLPLAPLPGYFSSIQSVPGVERESMGKKASGAFPIQVTRCPSPPSSSLWPFSPRSALPSRAGPAPLSALQSYGAL